MKSVLISGAGVAGPTLAYWLARHGFRPTVVELAAGLRSSGNPVDVRGTAVDIAERMGVMPRLREAATSVTDLTFLDARGRRRGHVNMKAVQRANGSREVELPRGDLARILSEAARDDAEFVFHDSIATMSQDADGVDVTFERSAPRRFDLVVGADGLHSTTRRLAFGPETDYVRNLGLYIATMPVPDLAVNPHEVLIYNTPGRSVAIHPGRGLGGVAFIFRHATIADLDLRDTDQHRRILTEAYAGDGWRVPEFLDLVRTTTDLYFDSVSQVSLDNWARGRIVLLGDAASSVSLFGEGSSSAVAGAYTLANELAASPDDHASAYARYEQTHRLLIGPRQRGVDTAANLLIPKTSAGIAVRNLATRLWPVIAAGGWALQRFQRTSAPSEVSSRLAWRSCN